MSLLNITPQQLQESAHQYRTELLHMPLLAAERILKDFTPVPNVRGKLTVGTLSGDIELAPYNATRVDEDGVSITGRTLETFLGSVIKKFDVNLAANTVYGSLIAQGEDLKNTDLAYQVLAYLAAKLGDSLAKSIWTAKRNEAGTKTTDLFDGFDSILEGHGGVPSPLPNTQIVDAIIIAFQNLDPALQDKVDTLYLPVNTYNAYLRDYRDSYGAVPYNTEYKKTFLEGTDNRVALAPQPYMDKGMLFAAKSNMLYGYGAGLAEENIAIEKHHPFLLDFVATMYFGVQIANLDEVKYIAFK